MREPLGGRAGRKRPGRAAWSALLAASAMLYAAASARAADAGGAGAAAPQVSPQVEAAIVRGLEFLARNQQPTGNFNNVDENRLAVSSLCAMAFMASGHTAGEGRYGRNVGLALELILKEFPADGYVGRVDRSRMYGQGIVTMTLAEAYGVERDPERRAAMRQALVKAVKVIVDAQRIAKDESSRGGWRYEPGSADSDLSLSGWNALALRACNNVGISVPKESIQAAVGYALRCYRPQSKAFGYQPGQDAGSPAMTGVGVMTLCLLDAADRKEAQAAGETLAAEKFGPQTRFPYYTHYYVVQAAFQLGKTPWQAVWASSSERLLALQQEDGGWPRSSTAEEPERTYSTAMAVLSLSAPLRLVPVNQR